MKYRILAILSFLAVSLMAQNKPSEPKPEEAPVISVDHQLALSLLNNKMLRLQSEQQQAQFHAEEAKRLSGEASVAQKELMKLLNADCGPKFTPRVEPGKETASCLPKPPDETAPIKADPKAADAAKANVNVKDAIKPK